MKYSENAYNKAMAVLEQRRQYAEAEQQRRIDEISRVAPEIEILQNNLKNTGFELIKLVLSGDKDTKNLVEKIKEKNISTQKTIGELLEAIKGDKHYLDIQYHCPVCKDTGFCEGRRCLCMNELLKKFTIDELNENCLIELNDFDDFSLEYYEKNDVANISPYDKMKQNLDFCKNYVENFNENSLSLLFIGKTGLGKTYMSSCIAKSLIEKNVNIVFGSIIDFLRRIENEHFGQEKGNTLEILLNADLVILDDLGSEFLTSFTEPVVYDIINSRINQRKPTIISTNLSFAELDEKYNERIVSRLTGCFVPIMFVGSDIRHIKLMDSLK